MKDTRFIKSIRLRNLLSFGPESEEIELRPLNVLIGPNASGKSNFIEAIGLLKAIPSDFNKPFQKGGGIREWLWKGKGESNLISFDSNMILNSKRNNTELSVYYRFAFKALHEKPAIDEELIMKESDKNNDENVLLRYEKDRRIVLKGKNDVIEVRDIPQYELITEQSILSQYQDPFNYPELTLLNHSLNKIAIFRLLDTGTKSNIRLPQQTDLPSAFLSENLSNLSLVIDKLTKQRETKDLINDKLRLFYNEADYITVNIQGGTAQVMIYEKGLKDPIPATRLSDGTLRYLCLLTILCHPEPSPLICIEEPEIGLHPDIMPTIAELLIEASKRTQLIVTTHSDVLISALSETPESILVCEHDDAGTHMRRLEENKLKDWLEKYSLGELWLKGEIGGTRW